MGSSWNNLKLADCHLKSDSKANAYAEAAKCYKKVDKNEAASCLERAANIFCEIVRLNMAARCYKEIAEYYESDEMFEQAIAYYETAAEFFQIEEVTTSANQCNLKVAQYAAQLEQYEKAIKIYEDMARHSLNNKLLKYGVKGHLLTAGMCHLCKADVVSITNALEIYQDLDPTFSGTRECKFLADLASAIDEEDIAKFTDVSKEFDSVTPLVWAVTTYNYLNVNSVCMEDNNVVEGEREVHQGEAIGMRDVNSDQSSGCMEEDNVVEHFHFLKPDSPR
ncbi:Tetratricopeptide-like helical domain superfamily [Arabidopsis thaliana x Arabidopsis arenosa]|uniref:Tetratricopeptide-like helical domain superfamily n=1 Tax=Arabidopsis thaliana x Arabidopsis arenosa TaxID=1240361 RepID=A0A8T1ZSG0_9BRAS|nr:Tetratricopeptide-like helical domain superfamily [Arabidopsis thaliana x Arabidopsis arenosa]